MQFRKVDLGAQRVWLPPEPSYVNTVVLLTALEQALEIKLETVLQKCALYPDFEFCSKSKQQTGVCLRRAVIWMGTSVWDQDTVWEDL